MRAAVVAGPRRVDVRREPMPEPARGQVLVRVEGCGVCGSNGPAWEGRPWLSYPLAPGEPGHEGWGIVEGLGADVAGVEHGMRVAMLSERAFAEYDVAPAGAVVPIPDEIDGPFPGEALGCAMNIFARSGIRAGQTVAIVGVGFLGAILTRLAEQANARVIAVSRRPFSLDVATRMGAAHTIAMDDYWRIIEQVRQLTGGQFCDVVIEAVGKEWPLNLAAELTRERGRLVVAGYHQDGLRSVNMQLWNWRGIDVINAHERDPAVYLRGMRAAVDAVASGALRPAPLYTHTLPLDELDAAFRLMRDRPDGFLKALVTT